MFQEPLDMSLIIDFETFQAQLLPTNKASWEEYKRWPVYDPALTNGVLDVRAKHSACGTGAGNTSCLDTDPDSDLYLGDRDNCPLVYNPAQRDGDGNGTGDACDQ